MGKRAVLGELGNKVLKNVDIVKGKESTIFKPTDPSFKHVKARVDTHWKKSDGAVTVHPAGKPVTRADSMKILQNTGISAAAAAAALKQTNVAKTTASIKPKVVHVTKGNEVKKVKVVNLKREESRLNRRSLTKLKQIRKQSDSSSITSSERSSEEEDFSVQEVSLRQFAF